MVRQPLVYCCREYFKKYIIPFQTSVLGNKVNEAPQQRKKEQLNKELKALGFEIIDNNTGALLRK